MRKTRDKTGRFYRAVTFPNHIQQRFNEFQEDIYMGIMRTYFLYKHYDEIVSALVLNKSSTDGIT